MRKQYLTKLKDLNSGMVLCEELKTRRQWIVTKEVFEKFRRSGFTILPKDMEEKIYSIFKEKDYSKLPYKERLAIIHTLLKFSNI